MFSRNSIWAAVLFTAALLPAHAVQLLFTAPVNSNLGVSSALFGASPYDVTAYGVTTQPGPVNLSESSAGLGLASDTSGEINTSSYVTLDFSDPENHGVKTAQIVIDGLQSGEGWEVYGWSWGSSPLNGLASATLLTSLSCFTGNTVACPASGPASGLLNLPNLGTLPANYRYFSIIATNMGNPSADVAVEEIDFGTAAPEPLTPLLSGAGLLALCLVRSRRAFARSLSDSGR